MATKHTDCTAPEIRLVPLPTAERIAALEEVARAARDLHGACCALQILLPEPDTQLGKAWVRETDRMDRALRRLEEVERG
jgi:hypothetical protein